MFCPKCGAENPEVAKFCKNCGKKLKSDTKGGGNRKRVLIGTIVGVIGFLLVLGIIVALTAPPSEDTNTSNPEINETATALSIYEPDGEVVESGILKINGFSEPNANVTINGEPITLNPDGSFTYEIPVQAPMEIIIRAKAPGKEESILNITIEELTSSSITWTIDCKGAAGILKP